ncbi:hypothetical protein V5799_026542, partial [Amblyomma americanum]
MHPYCESDPVSFQARNMAEFHAKDIGLRVQKKLLSRMSNKSVAKAFIDDVSASLLDNLYKLVKHVSGNKKEAEKIIKNIIKIVVKVGVLHRNSQFSPDEIKVAEQLQRKMRALAMAVVSFYEMEFSYDRRYLVGAFDECRALLSDLVRSHLTAKSMGRIEHIFGFFGKPETLDSVFGNDSAH